MIKVLSITNNFPPIIDGVGDYTYHLHNQLNNYCTHLIVCSNKPEIIEFVKYNSLDRFVYPIIERWNLKATFRIIKLARHSKIDTIHLQYVNYSYQKYGLPFSLIYLPIACKLLGIRFTIFFHEVSIRVTGYGFKSFILGILQRFLAWILCSFSLKVFVNTNWSKSLLSPFKNKIVVLPIPSNFENEIEKSILYKNINKEFRIVSFLNRCDLNLLKSISYLQKNKYSNIVLYLIGSSEFLFKKFIIDNIDSLNLRNVVFIYESTQAQDISDVLVNSSIYIQIEKLTNNFEGGVSTKSGAVMAAMQSALPIISIQGDMTDLTYFKNLDNILFIENNNISSIVCAINTILFNYEIFKFLGKNARNLYFRTNCFALHSTKMLETFNTI